MPLAVTPPLAFLAASVYFVHFFLRFFYYTMTLLKIDQSFAKTSNRLFLTPLPLFFSPQLNLSL